MSEAGGGGDSPVLRFSDVCCDSPNSPTLLRRLASPRACGTPDCEDASSQHPLHHPPSSPPSAPLIKVSHVSQPIRADLFDQIRIISSVQNPMALSSHP